MDLSIESREALAIACALSRLVGGPLHLAYAAESAPARHHHDQESTPGNRASGQVAELVERAQQLGAAVELCSRRGSADTVILQAASELTPELVVIAASGQSADAQGDDDLVGRIVRGCRRPVLIVRDAKPLVTWLAGLSTLKILLGADFSRDSAAAADFLPALRRFGPLDVVAHHVYEPPPAPAPLGGTGVRPPDARAALDGTLSSDLTARFARLRKLGQFAVEVEPHAGSAGARLAERAREIGAELLVVGSRDWGSLERLWEASVTRAAMRNAAGSVLCVPSSSPSPQRTVPQPECVLVGVDFSPEAREAVRFAYSLIGAGGAVHLIHVLKGEIGSARAELADGESIGRRLRELVPADASELEKHAHTHVVVSERRAEAICRSAEELGAAAVCLGSRSRTGPALPLGSVAAGVLSASTCPVILVKERRE